MTSRISWWRNASCPSSSPSTCAASASSRTGTSWTGSRPARAARWSTRNRLPSTEASLSASTVPAENARSRRSTALRTDSAIAGPRSGSSASAIASSTMSSGLPPAAAMCTSEMAPAPAAARARATACSAARGPTGSRVPPAAASASTVRPSSARRGNRLAVSTSATEERHAARASARTTRSVPASAQWRSSTTTRHGARAATSSTAAARDSAMEKLRSVAADATQPVRRSSVAVGRSGSSSSISDATASASATGRNGWPPSNSSAAAVSTRTWPRSSWRSNSATRRVLPTPASPSTRTLPPAPELARSTSARSTVSSGSRPTNWVATVPRS